MAILSWNVHYSSGRPAALALAYQLADDVVFLQEASAIARWHGPALSGRVQHQDWGRSVLVREGKLYPILVAG